LGGRGWGEGATQLTLLPHPGLLVVVVFTSMFAVLFNLKIGEQVPQFATITESFSSLLLMVVGVSPDIGDLSGDYIVWLLIMT
jgi:hypothetical protein